MKDSLFKSTEEMPPKNNSPDVVRVAQTMPEMRKNYLPSDMPYFGHGVVSTNPPRRGHDY